MMVTKLEEVINYLLNVKDDSRIPDKFMNLDANIIYDFLIELEKLRKENKKLKERNSDLKKKLTKKNIERALKNPYDSIGII